jgi:hypothetical protein|tara:strand:+ start:670 stop:966 length:297 start_codon:yes stop_codon:yes gene_type:complete
MNELLATFENYIRKLVNDTITADTPTSESTELLTKRIDELENLLADHELAVDRQIGDIFDDFDIHTYKDEITEWLIDYEELSNEVVKRYELTLQRREY